MQREKLSAMMDGEALDLELINTISCDSALKQRWESYHLVRDTLRNDIGDVIHLDIASKVAAALENEAVRINPQVVVESQPEPSTWNRLPFWNKIRPWASQITQIGVAACVSLAVIVGVQQYNQSNSVDSMVDEPVFNTVPVGRGAPVSLNLSDSQLFGTDQQTQQIEQQNQRINAMLQQYEIERRSMLNQQHNENDKNAASAGVKLQ
ncbi:MULTISPECIES: anti-sigma-E factor RseA [Providencia]|uniref:Anti-sigma-E factor RseA n=2 Tax=Providencia rustigianii TaxID=158850 RepID=D1P3B2_9GAMM|nr:MULTISPECIES: anti-sigma-E factor RseA [Providencia]EFB72028.1 anti sigma-E protein RseA domain protein [Providencia rustigianii DSM 4541]MTC55188.1 anti-sigma-E factor RseA [Providencia rustigianii]MTC61172.1 anti-sigma-E factor RseA [Providencia rustigianii]SPY78135.1 Sigma-E factor negative regulatory protein [Providencia rustigianii]SUC27760.1 Sigma-E factor negative regulatory protein [Providencia rustigianii]